ncbi:protein FAM204A [Telopea speciosissima]|uniref:protein FAM204A n=1 Tax=Telopea speciosissima TaxID=54955 RepID=UPI001CC360C7|nr:protein FAM204A [Telopea speciosissima]
MGMESDDDVNERGEAAIAVTPALQPNFQSTSVTKDQLNKFKELHKRRLQIKEGSKIQKSSKGKTGVAKNAHVKEADAKNSKDEDINVMLEDSGVSISKGNTNSVSLLQQEKVVTHVAPKKRQKLHWGLDTKERWERKANM